jgi:hypothetical protein
VAVAKGTADNDVIELERLDGKPARRPSLV